MRQVIKKVLCISLSMITIIGGLSGCKEQTKEDSSVASEETKEEQKEIVLWYTNSDLTNYLSEASKEYAANQNIIVIPKLVSEIDYIENMNQAVLSNEAAPDLFISENSNLEQLYLAGLTAENVDEIYCESNFYKTALNAFTYEDKLLAYPLYFDTSYLLYNQDYVETPPDTIDEILEFSEEFDAPEGVEAIFNWDVTDILCNYFFIGKYMNMDEINTEKYITDKEKLIQALEYYQNLNQYFAIDAKTVDYETAFQEFIDGKSVFTIAKTDKLSEIEMMEGDTSEKNQTTNQDESNTTIDYTDEEEFSETKEDETSKEEYEKVSDQDYEETSENNKENDKSSAKESGNTNLVNTEILSNYSAGVEKALSQCFLSSSAADEIVEQKESSLDTSAETNSNFKIAPLPNLTNDLESKGIAISYGVFVNGYTSNEKEAEEFAKYLTYDKAPQLYEQTGKLSSRSGIDYHNENISNVLKEYERDATTPKRMENEDFWLKLEINFSNIWKGQDVTEIVGEMLQ